MPIINRLQINSNNVDEHNEVLVSRQTRNDKNYNTSRSCASFPIGSTVVVQWEAGGLWTHEPVVGRHDHNYSNRSNIIRLTKTGQVVNRNCKHIRPTPITAKQYFRDQITKNTANPVDEILK